MEGQISNKKLRTFASNKNINGPNTTKAIESREVFLSRIKIIFVAKTTTQAWRARYKRETIAFVGKTALKTKRQ